MANKLAAKLKKYLPEKENPDNLVQAKIPDELFERILDFKERHHYNWSELIAAGFELLLDEAKKK